MNDQQLLLGLSRPHRVRGRGFHVRLSLPEQVRIARGYQQAVVKVTSYAKGQRQVAHHLTYISRNGKLELETDRGEILTTREEQKALLDRWAVDFDDRPRSRDAVNIVFSMPPGSSEDALKGAVRTTLSKEFPDHESVFAIHEDRKHPHAHAVIKMRGRETGKKLRLNKPELYRLREVFAEAAREQGVLLSASPRAARGIGQKAVKLPLHHMRERGIKLNVEREAAQQTLKELKTRSRNAKPWEQAMTTRYTLAREAFLSSANKLRKRAEHETDKEQRIRLINTASELEKFGHTMPKPKTQRQLWIEKLTKKSGVRPPKKDQDRGMEKGL